MIYSNLYLSTICRLPLKPSTITIFAFAVLLLFGLSTNEIKAQSGQQSSPVDQLDREPAGDEVLYSPADGDESGTTPPAFIWLPTDGVDRYILQYSQSPSFTQNLTTTVRDLDMTVHIPMEILQTGDWYWRHGFEWEGEEHFGKVRQFSITEESVDFPFVDVDALIDRIPQERPRLYFTPELVEEIRTDEEGRFDHLTADVIEQAEEALAMDESLFEEPRPWDEYDDYYPVYFDSWRAMRPYTQRMLITAMAYLYTGDERFADEARRRLMHFMSWDVDGPSSTIWPTELGMDIAENATPVFDWIYDTLTDAEREKTIRVLTARMDQINREVHRSRPMETRPFSSHPGRMVGFVVEGGIVLANESEEAQDWFDYTLQLLWSTYPAWGGDEGGWHEGMSYWRSYMQRILRVVHELDRFGVPLKDKPFFRNTGYFGLYAAHPSRATRAFGDGHYGPIDVSFGRPTYTLSTIYRDPYLKWHSQQVGFVPSGQESMIIYDPDLEPVAPRDLPQSRVFDDVGIAALHSNLADPENNIQLILKSNPFGAISHNHASQNAFVIEAFREPLAISSGSRQGHAHPHHRDWIWQSKAHNTILVNHAGQIHRARTSRGRIIDHKESGDYAYVVGDATEAYGGTLQRFHRHVLFNRPDYFVMIDDLRMSFGPGTFQWLLHSMNEMDIDETNNRVISRSGDATLTVQFLSPERFSFDQTTGFDPPLTDPDAVEDQFHLSVSTVDRTGVQQIVTVMWPQQDESDQNLHAEQLDADGGIALRVGNDLVLWKSPDEDEVTARGESSSEAMTVRPHFFIDD